MLNINETESVTKEMDDICSQNIINNDNTQFLDNENPNLNEQLNESVSESKGSGAKLVDLKNMNNHEKIEIDPNSISEQVNDIINEAVKINEAIFNDKNKRKNGRGLGHEINNNNNDYNSNHNYTTFKKENWFPNKNETELMANLNVGTIGSNYTNISSEKVPIQRITYTLNFQKNSDNSLRVSSASNSNTTEFSSTGPKSSILSDIEDGYKGHEIETRRKEETMKYEGDAKEDFIERQFGYLGAQDKAGSIERCNIISSTMIADKLNDTFEKSYEGKKFINELTGIIESKRLETLIKSKNETNSFIEIGKQSPLSNFHIGAYSISKNQGEKSRKIGSSIESTKDDRNSEKFLKTSHTNIQKSIEHDDINSFSKINNNDGSKSYEEFKNTKPIGRSLSFHTTFASIFNHGENKANIADLPGTTRSISYKSLNNTSEQFSSELSIADIPSLQSIGVMRSILNNSRTMDTYNKSSIQKSEEHQELDESKRRKFDINENKLSAHSDKTFTVLQEAELKSWKYQGPPSINLSTWGERHFFLAKSIEACSYNTCKLPVVRSVEFKKDIFVNEKDSIANDTLDLLQISPRPSNDESRIIQQNTTPNTNYKNTTITLNQTANTNQNLIIAPGKSPSVNPIQTFNVDHERHLVDQSELENKTKNENPAARAIFPENFEKPIFMQFALRKTGLKEKIPNECSSSRISTTKYFFQSSIIDKLNANHISKAPKPPQMLKKSLITPISMVDSRYELLNSIRNFNHDTLNRKCM